MFQGCPTVALSYQRATETSKQATRQTLQPVFISMIFPGSRLSDYPTLGTRQIKALYSSNMKNNGTDNQSLDHSYGLSVSRAVAVAIFLTIQEGNSDLPT